MSVYVTTKLFLRTGLVCYFSYQQNVGCVESYSTMFASSNRHFGHNFGSSRPVDTFQAGLCLDLKMRDPDCWPVKYFGKKNYIVQKPQENCSKKLLTFAFKILRFAEHQQSTKSCWGKKSKKRKTLHGIRCINKKIRKTRWSNLVSRNFSCLL